MSLTKFLFSACIGCLFLSNLHGQVTRSPFTTFGIGEIYDNGLTNNQGMGGIGVSVPQYFYINNQNPALLISPMQGSHNFLTLFEAGVIVERRTIASDTSSESTKGGNLNYLTIAVPVKPGRWVSSLSITPFSTVKYKSQYQGDILNSDDEVTITEEGSGGINQVAFANGVRLHRDLQVGFKAAYFFGSIVKTYQNKLTNSSQPNNLTTAFDEKTYVRDFGFTGGIAYSRDSLFSRNRYRITIGASYEFGATLKARQRNVFYRVTDVGDQRDVDTLATRRGSIKLPSGFSVGATLSQRGRWNVGFEMSARDWSDFRSLGDVPESAYGKAWRYAIGGEITPDYFADNYLKKITYRLGLSLEQTPYRTNVASDPTASPIYNPVKDVAVSFGMSMPAGRSSLDLGFRLGKRGDTADNFFQEDYFRIFFGVTFNDQWFVKRRFD